MTRRNPTGPVAAKGHALLMTLVLLAVLGAAVTSLFVAQSSAVKVTGDMISTRQAFYACDGISRSMVKLAQEYLKDVAEADANDMAEHVCAGAGMAGCTAAAAKLPAITPPGFTVIDFDIQIPPSGSFTSPLPTGPFQGMNARQTPVTLFVRAEKDSTGHACESSQELILAQIGLFQFFVFAEDYVDIQQPAPMTIDGRVHVNGDFCGTADGNNLKIKRVTASGAIYADCDGCPRSCLSSSVDDGFDVWDGSGWVRMKGNNDHGCTSCGSGWADYAPSKWNGHALDGAHDVPRLKVPVSGTPLVQDGWNAKKQTQNNEQSQRFLIDPPMFAGNPLRPLHPGDKDETLQQKFACKADIRIINGVWYLRDVDDESCSDWPGTPIWSDHPGNFTVNPADEEGMVGGTAKNVGQSDIEVAQAWGTNVRPRRYSHYEAYNSGALIDNGDTFGVVSYGNLFRDTSPNPDRWVPGMWARRRSGSSYNGRFCHRPSGSSESSVQLREIESWACDCSGSSCSVHLRSNYLQGTRGGFVDPRVKRESNDARSRILPMNFDVSQLAAALQDTSAGELGAHFASRDFNGIVWVTNTWDDQLKGFGNAGNTGGEMAGWWPDPVGGDAQQPRHTDDSNSTERLPYPLCGQSLVGQPYTTMAGSSAQFRVPSCGSTSRPNALRIHNAYTINPVAFPKGLSIVTNLPAYIVGDFNKRSYDHEDDWRPVLVAADALTFLSKSYDDTEAGWDGIDSLGSSSRDASDTHYQLAVISGDVSTAMSGGGNDNHSGGINNFPRFMEDWASKDATVYGSLVIGFRSVFQRYPWMVADGVYNAPNRDWYYDTKFDVISNHPPGAPVYEVQAMRRWNRN